MTTNLPDVSQHRLLFIVLQTLQLCHSNSNMHRFCWYCQLVQNGFSYCADSMVLDALSRALHPEHGSLVMNLHGGGMPTSSTLLALLASWLPFASERTLSGYHPSTEKGRAVQQITQNLR